MVYAPEPERWVHGDWRRHELDLPSWTWRHVTSSQGERLKPMTMFRVLLGRSGLPGPTRAVLRYLADLSDYRGHCYVRLRVIAHRTGYSRHAVTDALARAEDAGWLVIDRTNCRNGHPADYWLDVPDLAECPCGEGDCRPSEAEQVFTDPVQETNEGRSGDERGSGSRRATPVQETNDSTWVKHLGDSHLGDSHLRPASQDGGKDPRFASWVDHFLRSGSKQDEAELQAFDELNRIKASAA